MSDPFAFAKQVAAREARRGEIDRQSVNAVATNPAFVTSLHLPPIPPSPDRPTLVEQRSAKVDELVRAAAEGRDGDFRRILHELNPDITDLTAAQMYSQARNEVFQKRQNLLEKECVSSLGDRDAREFWMDQIVSNLREVSKLSGHPLSYELEQSLSRMVHSVPLKPGQPGHVRQLESLFDAAINSDFPAETVFRDARGAGIPITIMQGLYNTAYVRASNLLEQCAALYPQVESSDSAAMEFQHKYQQLLRLCGGLLPVTFGESFFAGTGEERIRFRGEIDRLLRASAGLTAQSND